MPRPTPSSRKFLLDEKEQAFWAHGLEGSLVEPDWPPLALSEVDRLLRRYPQTGGAVLLLSHSPRPFSAASVVETPKGRVFVKRHARSVRDREGLIEEHRFIEYLSRQCSTDGLVQAVLADDDGETAIEIGDWTYEVHPVARGLDVYEDDLSWTPFKSSGHAYEAGVALARMHALAEGYRQPSRKQQQLVSSSSIFSQDSERLVLLGMERYLDARPLLRIYAEERDWYRSFDELFFPLYSELKPWLGSLKPLWTHNDWHASNLMWSGIEIDARVTGAIDFGLCDRTNAIHDLATAIERNCVEWLRVQDIALEDVVHLDQVHALLHGYESVRRLSDAEARALVAMLPLVHCEFALSETEYFLSVLHAEAKAQLAYEGYFIAHAHWFRTEAGRRLLEHLESWANSKRGER